MNSATLFWLIVNLALYLACMLLLDGAHRAHIAELKRSHDAELGGMRTYIRTLNRERKWLEAELARAKQKPTKSYSNQNGMNVEVTSDPVHIQWLPPSEEYNEET